MKKRRIRRGIAVAASLSVALVMALPFEAEAHHDEVVDKLTRGVTSLISQSSSGEAGDGDSGAACGLGNYAASDDGRFIAFASLAGNLHQADVNGSSIADVFVYDRERKRLDLVSKLPSGVAQAPPSLDTDVGLCAVGPQKLGSHDPAISGNGRYVAFVSNLPLTGPDQHPEPSVHLDKVFIRDLKKGKTELVSQTWDGNPPTGTSGTGTYSDGLAISDDGRFVAFTSTASNIVQGACPPPEIAPGVTSPVPLPCEQIYVRDREKGETILVSKSESGEPANHRAEHPSMSGNGRFVVFESGASNLVPGDVTLCPQTPTTLVPPPPSCSDVFLHDLHTGKTELVSISRDGNPGADASWVGRYGKGSQTISDDGRFVLFHSKAPDLVPTSHHLYPVTWSGSYVRDRETGRTERVSVSSTGAMLQSSPFHSISDDGRYVLVNEHLMNDAYVGPSQDGGPYTPRDGGHEDQGTFMHDRATGQVDWILYYVKDGSRDGAPPGTDMVIGDIGGNGRFVVGSSARIDGHDSEDAVNQVYIRALENRPLGVGSLAGRNLPVSVHPRSQASRVVTLADPDDDALGSLPGVEILTAEGAEINGASLAYRPDLGDLFARIDLARLPILTGLGLLEVPLVYSIEFDAGGDHYELQMAGSPTGLGHATTPVFALSRCNGEMCTEIARLKGGYGTIGESVVASIPLDVLDLGSAGRITNIEASSSLGSYLGGEFKLLDSVS